MDDTRNPQGLTMSSGVNGHYPTLTLGHLSDFLGKACEGEPREPCTVVTHHDSASSIPLRDARWGIVNTHVQCRRWHGDLQRLGEV